MALQLPGDLTVTGMDQNSIFNWMSNVTDIVNELQADHISFTTLTSELRTDHGTFITLTSELKDDADFVRNSMKDALAKLDADGGITDTNYAALHGPGGSATSVLPAADVAAADVATITAAAIATLTNSTALTLLRS